MLLYTYIFAAVLGGILVGASVLLGGKDADIDGGFDADADVGFDKDFGADVGDASNLFWIFRSVRFWTFSVAFFGLTGVLLHATGAAPGFIGLAVSIAVGLATGMMSALAFRLLTVSESSSEISAQDMVGQTGRMLVAAVPGGIGKVRVEVRGSVSDFQAFVDDEKLDVEQKVVVIDIRGDGLLVSSLETEEIQEAPEGA